MARYRDANCKLCRREGEKLFLKGLRCVGPKCAIERRQYAPGQHGQNMRRKVSAYGLQLREKQKVRRTYGILERQFRNYFKKADAKTGITAIYMNEQLDRLRACRAAECRVEAPRWPMPKPGWIMPTPLSRSTSTNGPIRPLPHIKHPTAMARLNSP